MNLIVMCEINAVINDNRCVSVVPYDTESVNNELKELGIENTTNLDPLTEKKLGNKLMRQYKSLTGIVFTLIAKDLDTGESYILFKKGENIRRTIMKETRELERMSHRKI